MQQSFRVFGGIVLVALTVTGLFAGDGKLSGYMFGDYYYVAKNHDPEVEDKNGFWFRRIYFTYDNKLSEEWSVRFRMEMNSPGDFTTSTSLDPFLKDGYVKWSRSGHAVILGLSSTPTWGHVESVWGYRSVEKTAVDLYKFGSSRDFGLAAKGKFGVQKKGFYHAMVGNGSSTRSETNSGKKLALAVGYELAPGLTFEAYGDFEERPGRSNRYTGQGFLGYKTETWRAGGQFVHQTRQKSVGEDELEIVSAFGAIKLGPRVWGFARVDRALDALPGASGISYLPISEASEFTFFLLGVDVAPHEQVHLMPNVEIVTYDDPGAGIATPDTDVIPRVSFFYTWK